MKTVLITGRNGAIGSLMAEQCACDAIRVIGFGRRELGSATAALTELPGDLDVVFHFASEADVRESFKSPRETFNNNTECTLALLDAIRIDYKTMPRFVLASTPEVYGVGPFLGPIRETQPVKPANPYAASKLAQEALVHAYGQAYGIPYVITRAGSYVNPRRDDLALTSFARQIAAGERRGAGVLLKHGNLDTVRTWCDARDIAKAYLLAAGCETGETYNIAGLGTPVRLGDLLERLCSRSKVPVRWETDPSLFRPTDVGFQVLDGEKFIRSTGWTPQITLDESLDWLMDELRRRAA